MKIRHSTSSGQNKVEMQMTPMIDIVFQLLIFFVMSFKIASQEGDFNIKMPLNAADSAQDEEPQLPIKVRLKAAGDGKLAGIEMNGRPMSNFDELRKEIIAIVGSDTGPESAAAKTEVELDCDYALKYEYVVSAVTAVSGYISPDNQIVKLIEKIKFTAPKPAQ